MKAPLWVLAVSMVLGLGGSGWTATPPNPVPPATSPPVVTGTEKPQPPSEWAKRASEMEDIHDIRPPVVVGWDPRWRWVAVGGAALLAAGTAFWWWRRRPRDNRSAPGAPPRPPHEVALEALAGLESALTGETKPFYFGLTAVVRAYLDDRFGVDTREKTTEELLPVVRRLPLDESRRRELVDLFRFADPVKYADLGAEPSVRGAHLAAARTLVETTRPQPETPGA